MPDRENTSAYDSPLSEPDLDWVEPGFAIGSRPYDYQREAVAKLGIQIVVALHESIDGETEAWRSHGVNLIVVSTPDWVGIPIPNFDRVVEIVTSCLRSSTPVLIHCLAGMNRAPTCAAAVLCHARGMSVNDALAAVKRVRAAAKPTPEQEISLRVWFNLRCGK